ncbi:alpha,alpha-trehalase nth1 [Irineochytrium annulatum]|nr:alpha,alpha-trehalase nth1 [Irineochytrium annulatum]
MGTVHDAGPKVVALGTQRSGGYKKHEVRGTYMLSNLLQELALATDHHRRFIVLDEQRLGENPVVRLNRLIKYHFWDGLTRRIDADHLDVILADPKDRMGDGRYRIYVPYDDQFAWDYYTDVARDRPHLNLDVIRLPETITAQYVYTLNEHPGVLSLALRRSRDPVTGQAQVIGVPFVVPGGRFNEMYGWDSYFEVLGLLQDDRVSLARGMVDNTVYQVQHYGKVLNANRSYFLARSQPPFLSSMLGEVHVALRKEMEKPLSECTPEFSAEVLATPNVLRKMKPGEIRDWFTNGVRGCIKELFSIWLAPPRLDTCGLSKYRPDGVGIPPEVEKDHFKHVLMPFAIKLGMTVEEYERAYDEGEVKEPWLDEYFNEVLTILLVHDRAVRESGHDTTYRFDGRCADLATVDLNSLVYKYEKDLVGFIREEFNGHFTFKVSKGENGCHLEGFKRWRDLYNEHGADSLVGGKWDSSWAAGMRFLEPFYNISNDVAVRSFSEESISSDISLPSNAFPSLPSPAISPANAPSVDVKREDGLEIKKDSLKSRDANLIEFDDSSAQDGCFTVTLSAELFSQLAAKTASLIIKHLWSPEDNIFRDLHCVANERIKYDSVTTFWPLWAGVIGSGEIADRMIPRALKAFEVGGGLVAGTLASRGALGPLRPGRQWDYPYGWAPHQMLAWKGLVDVGRQEDASRIAYRWLYTIARSFVDFNGVVPEKFNVVSGSHRVEVEYGNVGTDFKYVVREGFGWMNASFQIGLTYLTRQQKRALGTLTHPDRLFPPLPKETLEHATAEDCVLPSREKCSVLSPLPACFADARVKLFVDSDDADDGDAPDLGSR